MTPNNYNIFSFIKRNARIYGNRIALIPGNERITHGQFLEKVNQLSCGLIDAGVEKGDRIAIFIAVILLTQSQLTLRGSI
jgi:non-ribosomal peptide synthetase component E (peptide arylation enzyme)